MDLPASIPLTVLSLLLVFSLQAGAQTHISECCSNGIKFASGRFECDTLPKSDLPYCSMLQDTCCLAKLEDMQCSNGINMARVNQTCNAQAPNTCQTMKRCCQCCLLGKLAQDQQLSCEAAQALGYVCGQIYRACCVGEEITSTNPLPDNNTVRDPHLDTGNGIPGNGEIKKPTQEVEDPFLNDRCRGGGPCKQQCTDTGTTVICTCDVGYKLKADGITCEDLNECLTSKHHCQTGERCVNTVGSYRCQREISCGTGYELTENNQCRDIDECETTTHNCGFNFLCQNTQGSFRCRPKMQCGTGFLQDAQGNCIDIDECVSSAIPCLVGYNCINTFGSYTCQRNTVNCGRGYRLSDDAARCVDIDECAARSNPCGEGHFCMNSPGSYRCECRIGYFFDSVSRSCVDENECRHYPGRLCAHNCENTQGSYYCSCSKGFKLSPDKRNCEDVNECEGNPCSQECANMYGSYQCYCRTGYRLSDTDGITCEDIDECALPAGGNICSYRCINIPGSFKCSCPSTGYNLAQNGRNCQDIDECITGRHNCSGQQSCFNVQGGFRCLAFTCPENYRKSSETRCERLPCIENKECQSQPLRITYYHLTFPTNIHVPTNVFRIGPVNAVPGDNILLSITRGNEDNYFSTQKLNNHSGIVFVQRKITEPNDFLLEVEMQLLRHGTSNTFLAKIYIVVTAEVDTIALEPCSNISTLSTLMVLFADNRGNPGLCKTPNALCRPKQGKAIADRTETFRCIKLCRPSDAVCILDPVNTISYTVISLPTYRDFVEPIEIIFLRTASPSFPTAQTDITFRITEGNIRNSFDIQKRKEGSLTVGVVRMVKPIVGPYSSILKLEMDYYMSGQLSHRNVVYVHIYISENWF